MTEAGMDTSRWRPGKDRRPRRAFGIALRAALPLLLALGAAGPAQAGRWTLQFEPMYMDAYGHDQHVLTIHTIDSGATPQRDDKTAVNLDTNSDLAYRAELRYDWSEWSLGVDFFWFDTSQEATSPTAAGGAAGTEVVFEVADRSFTSSDPSQVLFYNVLEDTDIAVWTFDLFAQRTLAMGPDSGLHLRFGLRFGDFDNDYRAVVGIRDVAGTRLDASSNYPLMMGPLLALAGDVRLGRHSIEGYIGQSVLFGNPELTNTASGFTGPFSSNPNFVEQEVFSAEQDVAIPITELRIKWKYRVSKHIALGLGANTAVWWDVPVPPGVIPVVGGDQKLHENTIVFFGLMGAVELAF